MRRAPGLRGHCSSCCRTGPGRQICDSHAGASKLKHPARTRAYRTLPAGGASVRVPAGWGRPAVSARGGGAPGVRGGSAVGRHRPRSHGHGTRRRLPILRVMPAVFWRRRWRGRPRRRRRRRRRAAICGRAVRPMMLAVMLTVMRPGWRPRGRLPAVAQCVQACIRRRHHDVVLGPQRRGRIPLLQLRRGGLPRLRYTRLRPLVVLLQQPPLLLPLLLLLAGRAGGGRLRAAGALPARRLRTPPRLLLGAAASLGKLPASREAAPV